MGGDKDPANRLKEELEKEDREEYIPQELEFLSDVVEIED